MKKKKMTNEKFYCMRKKNEFREVTYLSLRYCKKKKIAKNLKKHFKQYKHKYFFKYVFTYIVYT